MMLNPPGFRSATILACLVFVAYGLFVYLGYGQDLYNWSKSFAPHSVRQYLGMSKRYLLQYGHIVFLFTLLVLSRYIFLSNRSVFMTGPVKFMRTYSTAIFLFHFPILFFLVAVTDYDPASALHQLALFFTTLGLTILLGKACFSIKPFFDRLQKSTMGWMDYKFPRSPDIPVANTSLPLARSHSEFLDLVKIVAMLCVFLGHFSFSTFSTFHIPGFNGAAPRFAVPTFFMISGYFLMLSIDRTKTGALSAIAKRSMSLYYIVVPMLFVTLLLDTIGGNAKPYVYHYSEYYDGVPLQKATILNEIIVWLRGMAELLGVSEAGAAASGAGDHHPWAGLKRPYTISEIILVTVSSLAYFNESWLYNLGGLHELHGGMRAFSNDPYWFMCYLIPFSVILITIRLVPHPIKWMVLVFWFLLIGIPVLMLAPLFFSGSLAYLIHKHWGAEKTAKTGLE